MLYISQNDKRLYAFCEELLKSKHLEPALHEELSRLLNYSTKDFYYAERYKFISPELDNIILTKGV
jgi:hypothetical protein